MGDSCKYCLLINFKWPSTRKKYNLPIFAQQNKYLLLSENLMTDIPKALLDLTFFRAKFTFFILIFLLRLKNVNEPRGDESANIY